MNEDKSWQDALLRSGLASGMPSRRERVSELRALRNRMRRRHGYVKMLVAAVAVNIVLGWTLMIATGVLHGSWWRTVPTMGYRTAYLVTGLLFFGGIATIVIIQTARDSS